MSGLASGLPLLIDTHAHLAEAGLVGDLPGVLQRARAAGVVQVVAIGTGADDSTVVADMAAAAVESTCHRGGIGRRAWFRSMYRQRCGGSSPFDGTRREIVGDPLSV